MTFLCCEPDPYVKAQFFITRSNSGAAILEKAVFIFYTYIIKVNSTHFVIFPLEE